MMKIEPVLIQKAFDAIDTKQLAPGGTVSSEMMGYVASFGAAVIQSGLIPAVIFFSEQSSNGDAKNRPKFIQALHTMGGYDTADLLTHLRANQTRLDEIEQDVLDNAVALKMALRTFKKEKKTNPQSV